MTEGVILKLSTASAVKALGDLEGANKRAVDAIAKSGKAADVAAKAVAEGAKLERDAAKAFADGSEARKIAETRTAALGRATATAVPFVAKLAQAAGRSGAAQALGIFGDVARTAAGAISPVGIAASIAAGAVLLLAQNLGATESPAERAKAKLAEAAKSYDFVGKAADEAKAKILAVADSRGRSELDTLTQRLTKLKDAYAGIADLQFAARGKGAFDVEAAASLAGTLGKPDLERQIGELAKLQGEAYDKALASIRDSGFPLRGDRTKLEGGAFGLAFTVNRGDGADGVPSLDAAKAEELLAKAIGETGTELQRKTKLLYELAQQQQTTTAATTAATKGEGDVEAQIQRSISATQKLADVRAKLAEQTRFAGGSDADRRAIERDRRVRDVQTAAGVAAGSAEGKGLAGQVDELIRAEDASKQLDNLRAIGVQTFESIGQAIGQAALQGEGLRGTLANVAQQVSALLVQQAVSRAVGAIAGAIAGGGAPAPGGNGMLGRVLPQKWMMGGGILDRAQTIVAGGYAVNVAEGGGASPEAILPLGRDQFGRLGVRGEGGGGGTVIVNLPNVRTGEQARQVRPTLSQTVESVQRRGRRSLRAGK